MTDEKQIKLLRAQLKVEKAHSSWLDALADYLRNYANINNISDNEREDKDECKKEVDELYQEYKKLRIETNKLELEFA